VTKTIGVGLFPDVEEPDFAEATAAAAQKGAC
jgi:hypothetical protein